VTFLKIAAAADAMSIVISHLYACGGLLSAARANFFAIMYLTY